MVASLAFANIKKSYKDFSIYFITLLFGIAVFYAFNSIQEQQALLALSEQQTNMLDMLQILISGVSIFIVVILGFLIVYANGFIVKRRNNEFALYLLLGMSKARLGQLMFLETCIIGIVSLVLGLVLGCLISIGLLYTTSLLFIGAVPGFVFFIAWDVVLQTLVVFSIIFLLSLFFSIGFIAKSRIIQLLHGQGKNDKLLLRSPWVAALLFLLSLVLIASSYWVLIDNGFNMTWQFALATGLVCAGTLLFFFAGSSFLATGLRIIPSFYWRNLNAFTVRSIAARINSAFFSLTIICLTLFLALTSVSTGVGVAVSVQDSIYAPYSASIQSYIVNEADKEAGGVLAPSAYKAFNGSMEKALASDAEHVGGTPWDEMIASSAQVNYYETEVTWGELEEATSVILTDYVSDIAFNYQSTHFYALPLSQVNNARTLAGLAPLELGPEEVMVFADYGLVHDYYEAALADKPSLELYGHKVQLASEFMIEPLTTQSFPSSVGELVVPDHLIPVDLEPSVVILDVQFTNDAMENDFVETMEAIDRYQLSSEQDRSTFWQVNLWQTKQSVFEQSVGLATIVAYLAVYIGFVLVVACAAILAIQQLSNASDSRKRYELLYKLGASKQLMFGSLLKQIAFVFAIPLLVAIAHTICAMSTILIFISVFGHFDIMQVSLITGIIFLVVYGLYFLLTYWGARSIVNPRAS